MAYIVMMMTDLANGARLKVEGTCQIPEEFVKHERPYSDFLTKAGSWSKKLLASREMIFQEILRRESTEFMNFKWKYKSVLQLMTILANYPLKDDKDVNFIKEEDDRFRTDLSEQLVGMAKEGDDGNSAWRGNTPGSTLPRKRSGSAGGSGESKQALTDVRQAALSKDMARNDDSVVDSIEAVFADLASQREALQAQKCRLELKLWGGDNNEQVCVFLRTQIAYRERMLEQIGVRAANHYLGIDVA